MKAEEVIKIIARVEDRLHRAKLPFETNMLQEPIMEVVAYELINSVNELTDLIRQLHPDKFGIKRVKALHTPKLTLDALYLCPHCGDPECTSDHK